NFAEAAFSYLRGYGAQLFIALQSLTQLQRNYDRKGWESIMATCGAVMSYATRDLTTSRYLSDLCGKQTKEIPSYSQDRDTLEWRPSVSPQGVPLFMPQDLMSMEY